MSDVTDRDAQSRKAPWSHGLDGLLPKRLGLSIVVPVFNEQDSLAPP